MLKETFTPHPYAACYPLVSGILEESLYDSIKQNGLRQPLVLWRDEGRSKVWLIDGRNRYRALCQLNGGVTKDQVVWKSYESDEEVRLAVLDYNENRRQMSTAQKSVVAGRIMEARANLIAEIEPMNSELSSEVNDESSTATLEDEPPVDLNQNQTETTTEDTNDIESISSTVVLKPKVATDCPPEVRKEVASTLGIGSKTAQRGAAVVSRGAPKLVSALEDGLVSIEAAYTLTQLDDEELESVVSQGKEMMREKARELKGAEQEAKKEAKEKAVLGDVEVEKLSLAWVEKANGESQSFNIEVSDLKLLKTLLMTLTKLGLRGEVEEQNEDHSQKVSDPQATPQ